MWWNFSALLKRVEGSSALLFIPPPHPLRSIRLTGRSQERGGSQAPISEDLEPRRLQQFSLSGFSLALERKHGGAKMVWMKEIELRLVGRSKVGDFCFSFRLLGLSQLSRGRAGSFPAPAL